MCSQSDFLIGIETDADFTVLDFGMFDKIIHRRNDFGYTGFVISTQQCVAVGD